MSNLIEQPVINQTDSMQAVYSEFAHDEDFRELLEFFHDILAERQQELRNSLQEDNFEQIRVMAHQLKGSGGGYGFPGLSELARNLEEHCKAEQYDQIPVAVEKLTSYMQRIAV